MMSFLLIFLYSLPFCCFTWFYLDAYGKRREIAREKVILAEAIENRKTDLVKMEEKLLSAKETDREELRAFYTMCANVPVVMSQNYIRTLESSIHKWFRWVK